MICLADPAQQGLRAGVGLDIDRSLLAAAFCQLAMQSDAVLVVSDAAADPRVCDTPLVVGAPYLRFYAGAPLMTEQGFRLGTFCLVDTVARAFTDADVARLQVIASCVTQALLLRLDGRERERIAQVVAQKTKLLELAEAMAGVGTWSWDVASDQTVWSDQVYRIHGYPPGVEPPALQGVLERYHPEDARVLADCVQRAVDEGEDYALEARIYRPDGAQRHIIARGACRQDERGEVVAIDGTFQDVTEHVTAERFIRNLTDNLPGLIAYWDTDLRCQFSNSAYGEWFGRTPEAMLCLTLPQLLGPDLFAQNEPYVRAVLGGQRTAFARTLVKSSGEIAHTFTHYIPDVGATGRVLGFYVLVSDVTALKKAKRKLQETNSLLAAARDQAEASAAVKSEFLANMSHEIRTPLTAILGFTGLLESRSDLPEAAQAMVGRVKGASSALLAIVNDILDFSRLETGQMAIEARPVDVVALAEDTLALFGPQAAAKSLQLAFEAADDVPAHVSLDPDRLRQILLNLIGNAVKFTDAGSLRLRLAYDARQQALSVRVEDSGAGMDETQRARLFQRFSQVDASSTRRHGGTGLGLAISKGLSEAMGGAIGVESTLGQGSVFHFTVRAPAASLPTPIAVETTPPAMLGGVRVLVVDDNAANRELARVLLQKFDAEVEVAVNGEEAVALAARAPFDVLLLDLRMPVLDGRGALQRIRAEPGPNQYAPILAFTADGDGVVNGQADGFDGVIAKPVSAADMLATIMQATCATTRS